MIRFKHIFGPSIPMTVARASFQNTSARLRLFFLLFAVIAALFHPSDQLAAASIPLQAAFWLIGYVLFLFVYRLILLSNIRFTIARGWTNLYASIPLGLTNIALAVVMYGFARVTGIPTEDRLDLLEFLLFNMALYELGMFCYVAYADRVVYPEVYETSVQSAVNQPLREVFLRGSTLRVHAVEYIAAQENGVVATAAGEQVYIARPFSTVVAELPLDLGFQIHRSLWVSRDLALDFVVEGRRHFILLPDGRRFPVARARQRDYRDWQVLVRKLHPRPVQAPKKGALP